MRRRVRYQTTRRKWRWGPLSIIDYRYKVGSPGWYKMPWKAQRLSAWRYMHMVARGHPPVHKYGLQRGYTTAARLRQREVLDWLAKRKALYGQ